ncbi:MAG: hypothetical protein HW390_2247 [Candidatus Brocadiaceae bacterium]|nr:hypothetical protein [Candidatus Brocadiaceae bacterium]
MSILSTSYFEIDRKTEAHFLLSMRRKSNANHQPLFSKEENTVNLAMSIICSIVLIITINTTVFAEDTPDKDTIICKATSRCISRYQLVVDCDNITVNKGNTAYEFKEWSCTGFAYFNIKTTYTCITSNGASSTLIEESDPLKTVNHSYSVRYEEGGHAVMPEEQAKKKALEYITNTCKNEVYNKYDPCCQQ